MHNRAVIRRLIPISVCLALLQGLVMAPYQHIHPEAGHGSHHGSPVVHTHFIPVSVPISRRPGQALNGLHKAHASVSLETFTTLAPIALHLFFQQESSAPIFVPAQSYVLVEIIDPCGHDPPGVTVKTPRAPPV